MRLELNRSRCPLQTSATWRVCPMVRPDNPGNPPVGWPYGMVSYSHSSTTDVISSSGTSIVSSTSTSTRNTYYILPTTTAVGCLTITIGALWCLP